MEVEVQDLLCRPQSAEPGMTALLPSVESNTGTLEVTRKLVQGSWVLGLRASLPALVLVFLLGRVWGLAERKACAITEATYFIGSPLFQARAREHERMVQNCFKNELRQG